MDIKIDLHTHSTASDGRKSPKELVKEAHERGVSVMALTDHDTLKGLQEAMEYGRSLNVKVIPGVELSTICNGESIHILGYFKGEGWKDESLIKFLQDKEDFRLLRAQKLIENLKKYFNIDIKYEDVLKKSNGLVARPHIAQAIIDAGYPYEWDYIFKKFIGNDSPAYVPNKKLTIPEAIDLLHKHGAIVSLAHPVLIKKNSPADLLNQYDFDAIEAYYYLNTKQTEEEFLTLAHRYNKLVTCGSDYHGICNDGKHGSIGCVNFDLDTLKKLLSQF